MKRLLHSALVVGSAVHGVQATAADVPVSQNAAAPAAKPRPADAPNVVWILLDDVGFGASSTFGGLVDTPNLDALAAQGLRYTNFHTTAISSPTRAALLTGRNHHSVGMGLFPETANDQPGYNARLPASKGTVAEVLRESGYSTFAVGKWHLTPVDEAGPAGPYRQWPTGKGFDRYYGFLYGETDQWHPQLIDGTEAAPADARGRHLNELLTDRAIRYIANAKTQQPEKPFFLYFAPGATHAPHQAPQAWLDRFKGKFDAGWDQYREKAFARQKQLGIIPANTVLPARDPGVKAWAELPAEQRKLFARYFETYAAFLSYTDAEIGRLIDFLKQTGQYDNTIFAVVIGDNGASKEGTDLGTTVGLPAVLNPAKDVTRELAQIDKIGSDLTSPNYPLGWAQATNVPFRQWKQDANAEGGTRNPLILAWPKTIKGQGAVRGQYGHVIDLLPTTLELAGLKAPERIAGVAQEALEGVSLAYSVDAPKAPSRHTVQYYEINGTRAIYVDGWKASTLHKPGTPFDKDVWELYNLNDDPTEVRDLAAKHPEKLKELLAAFEREGKKYNVFPLKDTLFRDFTGERNAFKGRKSIELLPGVDPIFPLAAPSINSKPFDLLVDVDLTPGAEGVLLANGGRFGGSSVYVQNGRLHYAQTNGLRSTTISSAKPLEAGKRQLRVEYRPRSFVEAGIRLLDGDKVIGEGAVPLDLGFAYFSYDESFDVGRDLQTPVSDSYQSPYPFTGKLQKLTIRYQN